MRHLILSILPVLLWSCHEIEKPLLVPLTKFNLKQNALLPGDSFRLIYCSSQGNTNDTVKFLIQFVALRLATSDTINILATHSDGIAQNEGGRTFYFALLSEFAMDIILNSDSAFRDITSMESALKELRGHWQPIKVIQDPTDTALSLNEYPTVFGEVIPVTKAQVFFIED